MRTLFTPEVDETTWRRLAPADGLSGDLFGGSLGLGPDTLVVGARGQDQQHPPRNHQPLARLTMPLIFVRSPPRLDSVMRRDYPREFY